jgi:hypothetical protein
MTDRDVVDRIAKLWGRALIALPARRAHYKTPYATVLKGSSAVGLMTAVRPHMGRARQQQIDRAVRSFHGRAPGRRSQSPVNGFSHPRATLSVRCTGWLVCSKAKARSPRRGPVRTDIHW